MSDKPLSLQYARRDFLKLSSVAVAGLAGSGWPLSALAALRQLPASILSAGYAAAEPEEGKLVRLSPAKSLLMGDSSFIRRDAQVTMRSSRSIARRGTPGVAVDVVFPAVGYQPESYPIYHAWSFRQDEHQDHASGPVSFRVPIDATSGLRLLFTRFKAEPAKAAAGNSAVVAPDDMVHLSLGSASGAAKLRRGIYVVAYREPGVPSVANWSAHAITRRGNDIVVVPEAKFSYLVLSVDHAN